MLLWVSVSLIISISLSMILSASPLSLGLWILILALLISFNTSISISSWFGLVIFLIYIGGMLVIFAYFSALSPNEPIEASKIMLSILFSTFFLMLLSLKVFSLNLSQSIFLSLFPITFLYLFWNIPILIFLAVVLFFILVAVVKIASINRGALRHFSFSRSYVGREMPSI